MSDWQTGVIDSTLHYTRTGGDGPPFVLAHGYTDHGLCWSRVAQALEADYDLIMPDARGHGLSPSPEDDYSSALHAENLATLITALDLGQPLVMGHSMGGINAMYLAANHPEQVKAIILDDPPFRAGIGNRSSEDWLAWKARSIEHNSMSLEDLMAECAANNPGWHPLEVEAWAQAKQAFDPIAFEIFQLAPRPWREVLTEVQCPILLITADDGIVDAEMTQVAQAAAPHMKIVHIAHAGHSVQRDQFDEFIVVVRSFLQSL